MPNEEKTHNTSLRESNYKSINRLLIHTGIWIVYFFYENGAVLIFAPSTVHLKTSAIYFLVNALFFYLNYFLISGIKINRYRYFKRALIFILLTAGYLFVDYRLMLFFHNNGIEAAQYVPEIKVFITIRTIRFIYLISISYTYWLVEYRIKAERDLFIMENKRVIELEKMAVLEKEKLRTELNYLRLQINPHFIFNTLSFIYSEVIKYSEKASKSVMLLADIMGNVLIDPGESGEIPLNQEITHISNLIEIHQLRFGERLFINLTTPPADAINNLKIIPFILVTFVENAFKHGNLLDKKHPLQIKIELVENNLSFYMINKKSLNKSFIKSNGIGLANIKKRLNLTYPADYVLDTLNDEDFFTVKLNLKLKC